MGEIRRHHEVVGGSEPHIKEPEPVVETVTPMEVSSPMTEQIGRNFLEYAKQFDVYPKPVDPALVDEARAFLRQHIVLNTSLFEPGVKEVPVLAFSISADEMQKLRGKDQRFLLGFSDGPIVVVRDGLPINTQKELLVHEMGHTALGHRMFSDAPGVAQREGGAAFAGMAKMHVSSGEVHGNFLNEAIVEDLAWKYAEEKGGAVERDRAVAQILAGQRLEQAQPYLAAYALRELIKKQPRIGIALENVRAQATAEQLRTLIKEINSVHPELYATLLKAQYQMGKGSRGENDEFFGALEAVVNAASDGVYTKIQSKDEIETLTKTLRERAATSGASALKQRAPSIRFRTPPSLQSAGVTFEKRAELSLQTLLAEGGVKREGDNEGDDLFASSELFQVTFDAALNLLVYTDQAQPLFERMKQLKQIAIDPAESNRHQLRLTPPEQVDRLLDRLVPLFERPSFERISFPADSLQQVQVEERFPDLIVEPGSHPSVVTLKRRITSTNTP